MDFEKAKVMSCCSPIPEITPAPTPITTIKETVGNNCKAAREIDYVLKCIAAQVFGADMDKPDVPGEDTLEAALMATSKLLNSIVEQLRCFANRMGVET